MPDEPNQLPDGFYRCQTNRLHTTRKQEPKKIKIYYRFHPQYGKQLNILYSKKFKGEKHFAIEQPDGTYALLPAWLASPDAMKFTLKPKAYVSLESLLALQKFVKDYHKSSDVSPTLKSGGIYEKISAASNSATKFISRSRNSGSRISSRGKRKNNRAVKTVVNRHLQAKKKRRKK